MYPRKLKIGSIEFSHPIMNAAGCYCTTADDLIGLANSKSCAVVSKSCTFNKHFGNSQPRYYENEYVSINSTGLANLGYEFYNDIGKIVKQHKPYFLSVAGLEYGENIKIIQKLQDLNNFDFIELNLSCPNVIGKSQIGYNPDDTEDTLRKVFDINTSNHKIGLKLPPYFDMSHFAQMSDIFKQFPISFINCINSLGNGFIYNENYEPSIKPKNGYGGIGGITLKPIGLSNVRRFHELLPDIPIIGCGGVKTGRDICEYLIAGATLVQVGTQLMKEGNRIFHRLHNEMIEEMKNINYKNILKQTTTPMTTHFIV